MARSSLPGLLLLLAFTGVSATIRGQDEIEALIERLGHESMTEREKAAARLGQLGEAAAAQIEKALKHADPEIAGRADGLWRTLQHHRRLDRVTKDPGLRQKLDRTLRDNPGGGVLVLQVLELLRDGTTRPLSVNLDMTLDLRDPKADRKQPSVAKPWAKADADGFMFFITVPRDYQMGGYSQNYPDSLGYFNFVWDFPNRKTFTPVADDAILLPGAVFAPPMDIISPASGSEVSMAADPRISWGACPLARHIKIQVVGLWPGPDGREISRYYGDLTRECPKDNALPLSDILKVAGGPLSPGTTLELLVMGHAADDCEADSIVSIGAFARILLKE